MGRLKILIAEDDENIVSLYRMGLGSTQFERRFASNGVRVLSMYESWEPDIIVLDMSLPYLDGCEILKEIREELDDSSTVILAASTPPLTEAVRRCAKYGIQGLIIKPFSVSSLSEGILKRYLAVRIHHAPPITEADIAHALAVHPGICTDRNSTSRQVLAIELGMELWLQLEGARIKLKSFLIGAVQDRFLLIQPPATGTSGHRLHRGDRLTASYLSGDTIYSFKSTICGDVASPAPLLFLSFPEAVECHELREHRRVSCYIPAELAFGDTVFKGMILDMSCRGCRFNASVRETDVPSPLKNGDVVKLTLWLSGNQSQVNVEANVRFIRYSSGRVSMGLELISQQREGLMKIS